MLQRLARDTRGSQLVEYLMLLGMVGLLGVIGVRIFGEAVSARQLELAACVRALDDCPSEVSEQPAPDVVVIDPEPARSFMRSDPTEDAPIVTALPNTGTGPDPASAVRQRRPMTMDEAYRALAPLQDADVAADYDLSLSASGMPPLEEDLAVFAPGGPFTSVLTNPVYIFTDDRGVTSYFGLVDGEVVQIDFATDGSLLGLHVLDDYTAVMWLCEAGYLEACVVEAEMLARSQHELEMAALGIELVVGLTPAGIVLDARDVIFTCPVDPISFDCGSALLGFVPGVPGSTDEVATAAAAAARSGSSASARFPLTRLADGRFQTPGGLIYGSDPQYGNRFRHVLAHTRTDPTKPTHTVFSVPPREVLPLIDEAWAMRGDPVPNDPGAYIVEMGRPVGTNGETAVKIIVRPGTSEIVTAYPVSTVPADAEGP